MENTYITNEEALALEGVDQVVETEKVIVIDEQLVTDYIMIAGYTTTEAYEAAERVAYLESQESN